jgi:hypothetical protein
MDTITYFSPNDFSKGILEFAEKVEYAKLLQANLINIDENSIRELEKEIAERKWAIYEYLSDIKNYDEWKNFNNNNAEMLTKYVQKNYFQEEFSDSLLKDRLQRDFGDSLAANPELALTKREKETLKYYEENMIPKEKRTYLKEFDPIVANIHNKEKCFSRNFSRMLNNLPKKLNKDVEKILSLIKSNPLLLKDNPHHYVVNRYNENPCVNTEQLKDILEEANMGNVTANIKLSQLLKSMEEMNKGVTSKNLIKKYRKQFLGKDTKPSLKKET